MVAATVVAPVRPSASAKAKSARESFITFLRLCKPGDCRLVEARMQAAFDDGDGGGNGTFGANDGFDLERHVAVAGPGHAMGDDGGFERHHRAAPGQRILRLRAWFRW
jgi:hypothetical protein